MATNLVIGTPPGGILANIITWVRRIVKTPSDQVLPDSQIVDYINRFYLYDMPARLQLFELKRQYTFETIPNIFVYNFPFDTNAVNEDDNQVSTPGYQNLLPPAYCDGVQLGWYQSNDQFYAIFPEIVLNEQPITGDGGFEYEISFNQRPILRGIRDDIGNLLPYVYITTSDGNGNQQYLVDGGDGKLYATDSTFQYGPIGENNPPFVEGTVDYINGTCEFTFPFVVPDGQPIYCQTSPYSSGFPRAMLFFNNQIKLYPVPDRPYKIQCDAYITPAQFLTTGDSILGQNANASSFSYMSEYIARGAARKILSDNADFEQFNFYEPIFREQEVNVLRRTERQKATVRTPTIFSGISQQSGNIYTQY